MGCDLHHKPVCGALLFRKYQGRGVTEITPIEGVPGHAELHAPRLLTFLLYQASWAATAASSAG